MKQHYQLLVVGAGPAGMAAAQSAARQGVEVALIDEQAHPGGQIYRGVDSGPLQQRELLGKDYLFGKPLVQAFRHAPLEYHAATSLWYLDANRQMGVVQQGEHHSLCADHIILAGGAQERPMPIPGWQLPGVMGAGAAQILLKSAAMVPQQEVVLAGNGPLLLLLAWQYLQAGVKISALLDTSPKGNRLRAMRHLPGALAASDYLVKGLRLMLSLRRARIPWYRNVSELRAAGDDCLRAVSFSAAGRKQHIDCQLLLLHQGVIPALHLPEAAACELNWNVPQQCWQVTRDEWGQTSSPGIIVAGDAAAIGGARAAHLDGQLAGLQVAYRCGLLDLGKRDSLTRGIIAARKRHLAIRPFLDSYYAIAPEFLDPADECLVCRCEEVSAADMHQQVSLGCLGPNQLKAFTRCGMGPCQGRMCASTVEHIIARQRGVSPSAVGRFSVRPPLKPINLGQLARAAVADSETENE